MTIEDLSRRYNAALDALAVAQDEEERAIADGDGRRMRTARHIVNEARLLVATAGAALDAARHS